MPFLGTTLNTVGLLFLTHAVYSAHEHTATFTHAALPLDVTFELLVSIAMLSAGIVLSSPDLKPIQWSQWAAKIERGGRHGEGKWTREGEELLSEGDPYAFLGLDKGIGGKGEGRRGFWDVRGKRKEYAEWAREGAK
ncbi:magnesium transporter [Massariosphaeria phaeospora]|uniref:Magnesium transporter n=1 Tax=Massariosphaeria phaeospora TaxID=100035 RepID=A0A7C8M628_9PLEO|nr:magnesium transporter [Massariosphaeria phaeospora]